MMALGNERTTHTVRVVLAVVLAMLAAMGMVHLPGTSVPSVQAAPIGGNLVVNGSFEQPVLDVSAAHLNSIPGWQLASGLFEIQRSAAGSPKDGAQLLELDAGTVPSSVYQDVPTVPGTVYRLTFAFSPRPGTPPADNVLHVTWNGQPLAKLTADGSSQGDTVWITHTYPIVSHATATTTRLGFFTDAGELPGQGTYVDAVSVQLMTCESTKTGKWSSGETWSCEKPPGKGNDVVIKPGHKVDLEKEEKAKTVRSKDSSTLDLKSQLLKVYGDLEVDGKITSSTIAKGTVELDWSTTDKTLQSTPSGNIETYIKQIKADIDGVNNDAQMDMLRLQVVPDKHQTLQIMSNMTKTLQDTQMSIIRKVSAGTSVQLASTEAAPLVDLYDQTLRLETSHPVDIGELLIGAWSKVELVPGTSVNVLNSFTNDGLLVLTEGSTLTASPSATIAGTGSIEGAGHFWHGFLRPVDNLPTLNVAKAGSAIPVKFSLGGDKGLAIFAPGFPKSQAIECEAGTLTTSVEETVAAGSSSLSYDSDTKQYTYVWKTDKTWRGCRELVFSFANGMVQKAHFDFKK